ncbi:oligosaccharyl transferase beta subunit [Cylindrobasidium torrendii FP15055 ss-10]|uniref:Dolichyl-diphosphooligosaccharide--protein glycosyltransferase subunit WBP1 n=1 Tax=Cylindrobasidium torrendii FP15055 ss-10 TaxID=1314674 RepID=A0A0D7B3J9_9AGAR|nr:oligosaccharyl transferase beta subunit [Cylindrobasidium torrendii FP15055 ss-10]
MLPLLSLLISLVTLVVARSSTGTDVLVIVSAEEQKDYTLFFEDLEGRGYDLFFREPKAEKPVLLDADVPQFHHVLMLASDTKAFASDITPQNIVELLTKNVNVVVALSPKQNLFYTLAPEFGLVPPPPGTPLISYFPERTDPPTVLPVHVAPGPIVTPNTPPVWFSGIPFSVGNSPLLVPILNAPSESFASDSDSTTESIVESVEKGGEGLWAGSSLGLVTGFQVTDGGRALFLGGGAILSDAFANKALPDGSSSGNKQIAHDVSAWAFQESLVLRIDETSHHVVNATEPKEYYTTNDQVVYTTKISRWNAKENEWEPHTGVDDLQLEFTMLDPHVRTGIPEDLARPGTYSVTFRAPDRHGVFKFIVDYRRKGWTHLKSAITVPVVPPRHDGYPRFLSAAWPYYAGAVSTSVGFVLFAALYLAGETKEAGKKKKE